MHRLDGFPAKKAAAKAPLSPLFAGLALFVDGSRAHTTEQDMSGREKVAKVVASKAAGKGGSRKGGSGAYVAFAIVAATAAIAVGLFLRWDAPALVNAYV